MVRRRTVYYIVCWRLFVVIQGVQQGIQQGEMKRARETALNLHDMGMNVDFIAKAVDVSVDRVKQWLGLISA